MNRFAARLLTLGIIAAAVFAAATQDAHAAPLRVTTFRCDVTPPLGSAIYPCYRPLTTIEHPLLAKGIVVEGGDQRYVICCLDWCELCNSTHTLFRRKLARAAGTEISQVAVQTVHQHTAPMGDADAFRLLEQVDRPPPHLAPEFFDNVADRLAAAVTQSLERFEPFDAIGAGQARVERVASSRRVPAKDGGIRIHWSSCRNPILRAEPEGYIDPFLKTVTFARDNKPLVRLHYYATHPQSYYGDPRTSYDFPGIAREALEKTEGVFQIYFTGCAGDITAGKYNDGLRQARVELSTRLLAGMQAAVAATKLEPVEHVGWRTAPLQLPMRSDAAYSVAASRATMNNANLSPSQRIYAGAMRVAFAARRDEPIELSALSVGPVRILHLPGEAMVHFQLFAQGLLPDNFVAVAAYGDCGPGYICTERAFAEGGYEPTDSLVAPASQSLLEAAIRDLLDVE